MNRLTIESKHGAQFNGSAPSVSGNSVGSGWRGTLDLEFEHSQRRTIVSHSRHDGPLRIQKPFYPEDDVCHVYLLHPPGGVAGGDELSVKVSVGTRAAALVTTPAAAKIYRSAGPVSTVKHQLHVAEKASLEWLPQDSILFGGSRLSQSTEVHLTSCSRFCGWEITSMGRPASGDNYRTGEFNQGFQLYVDQSPVLLERLQWRAGDRLLDAPWGLSGFPVLGTFYGFPADEDILDMVRRQIEGGSNDYRGTDQVSNPCLSQGTDCLNTRCIGEMAVTLVDGVLTVRSLAEDAYALRQAFSDIWLGVREMITGFPPESPRVWAT